MSSDYSNWLPVGLCFYILGMLCFVLFVSNGTREYDSEGNWFSNFGRKKPQAKFTIIIERQDKQATTNNWVARNPYLVTIFPEAPEGWKFDSGKTTFRAPNVQEGTKTAQRICKKMVKADLTRAPLDNVVTFDYYL